MSTFSRALLVGSELVPGVSLIFVFAFEIQVNCPTYLSFLTASLCPIWYHFSALYVFRAIHVFFSLTLSLLSPWRCVLLIIFFFFDLPSSHIFAGFSAVFSACSYPRLYALIRSACPGRTIRFDALSSYALFGSFPSFPLFGLLLIMAGCYLDPKRGILYVTVF